MLSADMWFCDHSEWWGVWFMGGVSHLCFDLGGWSTGCSSFGAWFDLCGGWDIHIRVYESSTGKEKNVAPPTVRSCEQVAVAKFLLADTFG